MNIVELKQKDISSVAGGSLDPNRIFSDMLIKSATTVCIFATGFTLGMTYQRDGMRALISGSSLVAIVAMFGGIKISGYAANIVGSLIDNRSKSATVSYHGGDEKREL